MLVAVASLPAEAAGPSVSGAWFRALPAGRPAGGYFKLQNNGSKTLTLTAAGSTACGMVMLHRTSHEGGMEHMAEVPSIDVAPGASFEFAPGGYHLMCMDPTPAMRPGARVPVVLEFADGTKLEAVFSVRDAAGR